jgi:hypothetical protein
LFAILNLKFGIYLEFDLLEIGIMPKADASFGAFARQLAIFFSTRKGMNPACGRQASGFYPWKTGEAQHA